MKGGPPGHIFNFLVGGDGAFDASFEAVLRFKDKLQPLLTKVDPRPLIQPHNPSYP